MAPSAVSASNTTSRSGIRHLDNGDSVIPASTRADGSVRKEIRVKAGYRPPEDVEVYKNRTAEAWKSRGSGGVPGAEKVEDDRSNDASAAANKNAKRREARKKAAAVAGQASSCTDGGAHALDVTNTLDANTATAEAIDPHAEKVKEARKLAKKVRQARDLQGKKDSGGSLLPEQIAKVIKINELVRQLDSLGFDENGDEKANG